MEQQSEKLRVHSIKARPEKAVPKEGRPDIHFLQKKAAGILRIQEKQIRELRIVRYSIDARKKPDIFVLFSVDIILNGISAAAVLKRCKSDQVTRITDKEYVFPKSGSTYLKERPVIIGTGPAGLFCGYELALHGYHPILLERGADVDTRTGDVAAFWEGGELDPNSNVQFGEGGAGTFSDGKLNTLIKDKDGRNREVLRIFCRFGAKEEILYDYKPHLGTDELVHIVKRMREEIVALGGEVHFHTQMVDFETDQNRVTKVITRDGRVFPCGVLVLAIGHSARDTFRMLYEKQIPMEAKSFAVGLRVEHLQEQINMAQYGKKDAGVLGAAPYKLTAKTTSGRGVYSFCMCPGGYVVNASSQEGRLAVNGMSYSGRDSKNANSAIIVTVTPQDFCDTHPLAGIRFQETLEEKAYRIGQGNVPVEYYTDFKKDIDLSENQKTQADAKASENPEKERSSAETADYTGDNEPRTITPCIKGRYTFSRVSDILPGELGQAFVEGMEQFDQKIPGFAGRNVLVEGIESRTSSPVRISRDDRLVGNYSNLYPCGEGAGYAGGITSAAMDGMRVAEMIALEYTSFDNH